MLKKVKLDSVKLDDVRSGIGRLFKRVGLVPHRRPPYLTRDWRWHYRPDARAVARLGPDLSSPTIWSANPEAAPPDGELAQIFLSTPNLQKWMQYLPIYEHVLTGLRNRRILFLEIGVDRGGSLEAWRRYLGPEATIVGVDINPTCAAFDDPSTATYVRIGSQDDAGFLGSVVEEFGAFDVILDDGSHFTSHQIASFRFLFPHGVAPGGRYLVEDLQTNYWRHYRDSARSFIDMAKDLVDVANSQYQDETMLERDFRIGSEWRRMNVRVPLAARLVESIEFHDGIVVINKALESRDLPGSFMT
ncbi:MAG TPA: class I SAM-dependent methyltransferase [Actinomycetota bacterium]|nr:class I SAM-dependent methyltransferase [Actinomycetota bacterium]